MAINLIMIYIVSNSIFDFWLTCQFEIMDVQTSMMEESTSETQGWKC